MPEISVIVNCYNSSKYLKEALESIFTQDFVDYEVIFWDNQSKDESSEIAKSFNDKRLKYFYAPEFLPLGPARNEALKKCKGKYICYLDCDDVMLPGRLSVHYNYLELNNIDAVWGDFELIKQNGESIYNIGEHRRGKPKLTGDDFNDLFYNGNIIGMGAIMHHRKVIDNGYFFGDYCLVEDFDMWLKILFYFKSCYLPELTYKYRVHEESLTSTKGDEMYLESIKLIEFWEAQKLPGKRGSNCSRLKSLLTLREAQRLVSEKQFNKAHILSFKVWKKNFYKLYIYRDLLKVYAKLLLNR